MGFFNLFQKNNLVLLRCTDCCAEFELAQKPLCFLLKHNSHNNICPIIIWCHFCDSGLYVPVNYTDNQGNHYTYSIIKEKLNNLPDSDPFFDALFDLDSLALVLS